MMWARASRSCGGATLIGRHEFTRAAMAFRSAASAAEVRWKIGRPLRCRTSETLAPTLLSQRGEMFPLLFLCGHERNKSRVFP